MLRHRQDGEIGRAAHTRQYFRWRYMAGIKEGNTRASWPQSRHHTPPYYGNAPALLTILGLFA
jgi:hypothetical protein